MATPWIFTSNTFEVQTRNNFKRMLTLSNDHMSKLNSAAAGGDADFVTMRNDYQPINAAFNNIYALWQSKQGLHEGSTVTVEGLLLQLSDTEIKDWETAVRTVFREDSANEQAIFPNNRRPFQAGTYEQRINAVKTLSETLATFSGEPTLVALSATVLSFHNTLFAARDSQQGGELAISGTRTQLEAQRILCAQGMYGNLGRLMYKYRATPIVIEQFWDLSLLRDTDEPDYIEETSVSGNTTVSVDIAEVVDEIEADTQMIFENKSSAAVTLLVGFASADGSIQPITLTMAQNETRELSASEAGWSEERKNLRVQNEQAETGVLKTTVVR